jgi:hypothetical protein
MILNPNPEYTSIIVANACVCAGRNIKCIHELRYPTHKVVHFSNSFPDDPTH